LSISAINMNTIQLLKRKIVKGAAASLFCGILTIVYNHFGHGVHSVYMDRLFLFPLLLGTAVYALLLFTGIVKNASENAFSLYACGITTLTVGSLLKGVFVIAGTNSPYLIVYWSLGIALLILGAALQLRHSINLKKRSGCQN